MEFTAKQISPPKDWGRFEDLCRALFGAVWGDLYAQKNGRTGQPQHGVDIWGNPQDRAGIHCVQCKGKDANYHGKVTPSEFDDELAKAEHFEPKPEFWILATTAPNDGALQQHARLRSTEREAQGKFPVAALGWETLIALMGEHPKVIEQFYPEHGDHMQELLAAVRALPSREDLRALLSSHTPTPPPGAIDPLGPWVTVTFGEARGFGPALLGRALGAADVGVCPRLPEASVIEAELRSSFSARLAGVPGAGKSVCALQAAEPFAKSGFRVVRLRDPRTNQLVLTQDNIPTVHLIDDAHLTADHALTLAEHSANSAKLLLSTFTVDPLAGTQPGTVHLDARRAVTIIADDLRSCREETLAAVRQVDDWVGDGLGQERLEGRLDAAAQAEFPWQFCFILSGGWRRVHALVASARAAKADLVLAAVAIRQLATRDARATAADLAPLLTAAGIGREEAEAAYRWLVEQRIVISGEDLRCPHQRFSAKVFDPILKNADAGGRQRVVKMMAHVLSDPALSLAGLGTLLAEFRISASGARWTFLIGEELLAPFLSRCWAAETPEDIASAARALREIDSYLPDAFKRPGRQAVATIARWFSTPQPGMAYSVGNYINGTYRNRRYGRAIVRASDPDAIADALNAALAPQSADFASEIAKMITQSCGQLTPEWTAWYLARVERGKCLDLVANWPAESSLFRAAWFCAHFVHLERDFGLDLINALGPAIRTRMRADPIETFDELKDIFWHALRIFDPLGTYKGKLAPTTRMREVCGQLCGQWEPEGLAGEIARASTRQFQNAAGLLNVVHKSAPDLYAATVAAMDWGELDRSIGTDWAKMPDYSVALLCQFHADPAGRIGVARLIDLHVEQLVVLDTSLAFIAPDSALRQIERGAEIGLSQDCNDWQLRAGVLANFHKRRPDLVEALLDPHTAKLAEMFSKDSPTYFEQALPFLRVCRQVAPSKFADILAHIDVSVAEVGWTAALTGVERSGHKRRHPGAREAIAWLVHVLHDRTDALGELALRLMYDHPTQVRISARKFEPYRDL